MKVRDIIGQLESLFGEPGALIGFKKPERFKNEI